MQSHEFIPWLGSLALESLLIFFILKNRIHKRFPTFFAYVIFDILRAIILPVFLYADPHSGGIYFCAYWLVIPIEYTLTFLIILEVFAYIFRAHIKHSRGVIRAFVIFGSDLPDVRRIFRGFSTTPVTLAYSTQQQAGKKYAEVFISNYTLPSQ